MKNNLPFENYLSPFSWRYGSEKMRHIFSEQHKHELWRKIWVILAEVEHEAGLVSKAELLDLQKNQMKLDISRIHEIEKDTKHDVVAAIKEFAEVASVGGGKIHLGATSMDIVDNADTLRLYEALTLIGKKVQKLLLEFSKQIEKYSDSTCIGYTHLQPAEPTTVGYRLSLYAQDLLLDFEFLQFVKNNLFGKGMKGAVGTRASYTEVLNGKKMTAGILDTLVMKKLGIPGVLIANQVSPRKFDYLILTALATISQSLAKFAADLRLLQSPGIGEWSEPFGAKQVGSSAMPFKKNPMNSEKICSLARFVTHQPTIGLENAMHSYLERTLDDSANKRVIMPESFLAVDEILTTAQKIISGLVINTRKIAFNLKQYGPFAATESIIIAAVKCGANRQEMHELTREISLKAWSEIQQGKPNPMIALLNGNSDLKKYLNNVELEKLLDVSHHVGDAPKRAKELTAQIKKVCPQ